MVGSSWILRRRLSASLRGERCLKRLKDRHLSLQPRKVQEDRRCRTSGGDHRKPPAPVVKIYKGTEPARVNEAD